jgi:hypothetical protein
VVIADTLEPIERCGRDHFPGRSSLTYGFFLKRQHSVKCFEFAATAMANLITTD